MIHTREPVYEYVNIGMNGNKMTTKNEENSVILSKLFYRSACLCLFVCFSFFRCCVCFGSLLSCDLLLSSINEKVMWYTVTLRHAHRQKTKTIYV